MKTKIRQFIILQPNYYPLQGSRTLGRPVGMQSPHAHAAVLPATSAMCRPADTWERSTHRLQRRLNFFS